MQWTTRRAVPALIAGTLIALAAGIAAAEPKVGQPAPPFSARTLDGKMLSLADYRGKSAVLLNFYANF